MCVRMVLGPFGVGLRAAGGKTMNKDGEPSKQPLKGLKYGPLVWALGPFRGILGTLLGTYDVYSGYIRIPGLRAHTRGPWF